MKLIMLMVNKKTSFITLFLLAVLGGLLLPVLAPIIPKAYAAVNGEVIDRSTIKVGEQMFFDRDMDDNFNYKESNPSDACEDEIRGFDNDELEGTNTPDSATIRIGTPAGAGSNACNYRDDTINFGSSRSNFQKAFAWVDNNTIVATDTKLTFTRDGSTNIFISDKSDRGCSDTLAVSNNNRSLSLIERKGPTDPNNTTQAPSTGHDYDRYPFSPGRRTFNSTTRCWEAPAINGIQVSGTPEGGNPGAGSVGGGNAGANAAPSCESEGGVMSWIICPLLFLADQAVRFLDNAVSNLLTVPNDYFDNPDLEEGWKRLRGIAYAILIPIMLIMVISTALGFEFISAYTVKKALPRLIAAVLFIALSFELCKFLIIFTNDIGSGIHGLITGAFTGTEDVTLAQIFSPDGGDSVAAGALIIGAGTAALAVASIGILFSYMLVLLVGMLMAFFLLSFRQMLLIALLMLAPLAILAWIFPGNDKLWKLWWGTFSKLLLLYPLIMVLIASGKSFAVLVGDTADGNLVNTLLKIIAYVGPYFFIPAAFKFAGGIFANVAGMANDRSRGLFDRNKKYRAKKMGENWQDTRNFNRFKGNNAVSKKMSRAMGYASNMDRAGLNAAKWKNRLSAAGSDNAIHGREAMLEDKEYTWKGNDDLNKAAYMSRNEADLRRILTDSGNYADTAAGRANMERDIVKVERFRRKYGDSAFRQATWLQSAAGGTAHDSGPGSDNVWQGAASVAGNDDAILADLVAKGRSALMSAGRVDEGGAGFMDTFRIARQFRDNAGYTADQGRADLARRVYDSQGGNVLVHSSMKTGAVEALAPEMVRTIDTAIQSGDTRSAAQSLASLAAVYEGMNASSPEKARVMADQVMSQEIDVSSLTPEMRQVLDGAITTYGPGEEVHVRDPVTGNMTVQRTPGKAISQKRNITIQQAIEAMRGNQGFQEMRREYQSQVDSMRAQPIPGPGGPPTGAPTGLPGGP